jgi:RNA polymerase sigma-70 factor (ECF subfamily)
MQLYTPEHGRLCRYVQSFVWDKEEAKDIISETTLHAFEQFAHLKSEEKFVPFLFGIARNQFLKYLRKKQLTGSLEEHQLVSKFSEQQADAAIMLKFELMRLLEKLNPLQKELLVLFEISGLSYQEMAQLLDIKEAKVKDQLHEARKRLKELVQADKNQLAYIHNRKDLAYEK